MVHQMIADVQLPIARLKQLFMLVQQIHCFFAPVSGSLVMHILAHGMLRPGHWLSQLKTCVLPHA
jgi:hypothetical protein